MEALTRQENYTTVVSELRSRAGEFSSARLALVSFAIGGVLDFLGQARTTRDVWAGSYLLSHLSFTATRAMLEALREVVGAKDVRETLPYVLLPNVTLQPQIQKAVGLEVTGDLTIANFPNTILLVAPGDGRQAQYIATAGKDAVARAWKREIVGECRKRFFHGGLGGLPGADSYVQRQWDYQTEIFRVLELYTSVIHIPDDESAFRTVLDSFQLPDEFSPGWAGCYGALIEWSGKVLGARKMIRDFEQIGQEGRRCSLCGARSALADYETPVRKRFREPHVTGGDVPTPRRTGYRDRSRTLRTVRATHGRLNEYWEAVRHVHRHRFRDGERLCAVCIVRRLAPFFCFSEYLGSAGAVSFPSTSTLSTSGAIAELSSWVSEQSADSQEKVATSVKTFVGSIREGLGAIVSGAVSGDELDRLVGSRVPQLPYFKGSPVSDLARCEGHWFFPESYDPDVLRSEYSCDVGNARQAFRANPARKLAAAFDNLGFVRQPGNYYAVIAADGDHMGEWLSGKRAPSGYGPRWQAKLSGSLSKFSLEVQRCLEQAVPGKLIYAGGDDVLAFVPREYTLHAIRGVAECFRENVAQSLGVEITLSIGCVVARHNDPLSGVIQQASRLLKEYAKRRFGRNAFAIYRTTDGVTTGMPFHVPGLPSIEGSAAPESVQSSLRALDDLLRIHKSMLCMNRSGKGLSGRVVGRLSDLRDGLAAWTGDEKELPLARLRLLRSAVQRHLQEGSPEEDFAEVPTACESLCRQLEVWTEQRADADVPNAFETLTELMSLLRFLAK